MAHIQIAVISTLESVPWTGCEELWAATAAAALEDGHQVFCSVCRWPTTPAQIEELQRRGAQISWRKRRRLPSVDGVLSRITGGPVTAPRPHWLSPFSTFREAFHSAPDVVLLSQAGTYDFCDRKDVVSWLDHAGVPYVIVNQLNLDYYPPESRNYTHVQRFFAKAAHVGFVSENNLRLAERQLAMELPNASVLQNPVNLSDSSIVPWPGGAAAKFACLGRLDANHKGQDVLLQALAAPPWRDRKWQLGFYGGGPDEDYLQRLTHHYGLADRVVFAGHKADVRSVWAENHLMVLASRREGTPLALIEAMLCGRPAVATNVGGNAEWLDDARTGFVAEAPTPESVGAALERSWAARSQWREMGQLAHAAASSRRDVAPGRTLLKHILAAAPRAAPPES